MSRLLTRISKLGLYDAHLYGRKAMRWIGSRAGRKSLPLFTELTIETTAHCNRHCPACPVSLAPRGKGVMDEALFAKVLAELGEMRYSGRIALHFFNEPLLDKEIVSKVHRINEAVPRASIEIFSNGDFLNNEMAESLFDAGLAFMLITAYNERAMKRLLEMRQHFSRRTRKRITIRRDEFMLNNRAGALPELSILRPLRADCFQPSYHMTVNYKGEVVICTSDYFAASVMGHIAEQSLMDIWQGSLFQQARQLLKQRERDKLSSCRGCNVLSTPLAVRYLSGTEVSAFNRQASGSPQGAPARPAVEIPTTSLD